MIDRGDGDRDRGESGTGAGRPGSASENVLAFLLYVLRVFTTRFWVFVAVVLLVMGLMAYTTLRSTPIYRATGTILIERQHSNLRQLDDPLQVDTSDVDYYNTQVKIMQGLGLADRVVRRWLCKTCVKSIAHDPAVTDAPVCPTCKSRRVRLSDQLGPNAPEDVVRALDVVLARSNRIVEVSVEHQSPPLAADLVNAVIEEYQANTQERRKNAIDLLYDDMMGQLKEVEADVNTNQIELLKHYQEHGLHIGDEFSNVLQRQMEESHTLVLREQYEVERLQTIVRQIEAVGDDVPALRGLALAHGMLSANDDLQGLLVRAETDMASARQDLGEKSNAFKQAQAKVDELRTMMAGQARAFKQSVLSQRNVRRESLERAQKAAEDLKLQRKEQDKRLAEAEIKRRTRDGNRALYDALNLRAKEARISKGLEAVTNIHVLRLAVVPKGSVRPNLPFNMLIAFVVALIIGAAAIVLLDRIDNTVRTTEDVELVHTLPVLSVVPQAKVEQLSAPVAVACWKEEHSQLAEAFRRVRAAILLSVRGPQGGPIRQILVVSPGPNEGKTITAVNLAISLAQMGERTLLLDADFYRSESHKLFGLDREKGLSTLLVSDVSFPQVVQPTAVPFLDYMATGMTPPQPASLLGSARMTWVLQEASRTYSRVVIDTAPLVAVTDATLLAPHADATLLVVRDGRTSKTALHRSLQTLQRIGVRPLGFVFNGVRTGVGEFYFRYHHPSYELLEPEVRQPAAPSQPPS